jgi:hypothetical protein
MDTNRETFWKRNTKYILRLFSIAFTVVVVKLSLDDTPKVFETTEEQSLILPAYRDFTQSLVKEDRVILDSNSMPSLPVNVASVVAEMAASASASAQKSEEEKMQEHLRRIIPGGDTLPGELILTSSLDIFASESMYDQLTKSYDELATSRFVPYKKDSVGVCLEGDSVSVCLEEDSVGVCLEGAEPSAELGL